MDSVSLSAPTTFGASPSRASSPSRNQSNTVKNESLNLKRGSVFWLPVPRLQANLGDPPSSHWVSILGPPTCAEPDLVPPNSGTCPAPLSWPAVPKYRPGTQGGSIIGDNEKIGKLLPISTNSCLFLPIGDLPKRGLQAAAPPGRAVDPLSGQVYNR